MSVQDVKLALLSATDLSRDAFHVYLGLAIFVAMAVMLRRPLRSIIPWLAVLGVAVLVELVDVRDDLARFGHWRWGPSLHDFINMLFWPTVLLFLGQRRFTSGG